MNVNTALQKVTNTREQENMKGTGKNYKNNQKIKWQ